MHKLCYSCLICLFIEEPRQILSPLATPALPQDYIDYVNVVQKWNCNVGENNIEDYFHK